MRLLPTCRSSKDEGGFALLLAIFVIALTTIIVLDFGASVRFDQRVSRAFAESTQADYVLKSGLNLAKALIVIPKLPGIAEDWLGDPWSLIASAPALPISGFIGEPRIMIVDEDGKIDINSIVSSTPAGGIPVPTGNPSTRGVGAPVTAPEFWRNTLNELFIRQGFFRETYEKDSFRTRGDAALDASVQVATLHDWIDSDTGSFRETTFDGEGIESRADKTWFYNRRFYTMSELALVPGMTLERVNRIAPYVRISAPDALQGTSAINVNTAPLEVLLALGFPESIAVEMVLQRLDLPIDTQTLKALVGGNEVLQRYTKVTSNEFSVYIRVVMPNTTRWMRAYLNRPARSSRVKVRSVEFY